MRHGHSIGLVEGAGMVVSAPRGAARIGDFSTVALGDRAGSGKPTDVGWAVDAVTALPRRSKRSLLGRTAARWSGLLMGARSGRWTVAAGAGIGLAWGVSMRAWMRYIAAYPQFTWEGTLAILVGAMLVGALLGFARLRRQAGGAGWWRLTGLSLALSGGGGAVMWPSVVLGAIAFGRPRPTWVRLTVGLVAVVAQVPVLQDAVFDKRWLSGVGWAVAVGWYLPMVTMQAWGFSVVFAPLAEDAPTAGPFKRVVLAAPLGVMAIAAGVVAGMSVG